MTSLGDVMAVFFYPMTIGSSVVALALNVLAVFLIDVSRPGKDVFDGRVATMLKTLAKLNCLTLAYLLLTFCVRYFAFPQRFGDSPVWYTGAILLGYLFILVSLTLPGIVGAVLVRRSRVK